MWGILLLVLNISMAAEPEVVVAALARVGDSVITSRDLQIHLFLNEIDNPLKDFVDRADPLKDLVSEYLIVKEAQSLLVVKVSDADLDSTQNKWSAQLQKDRLWQSLHVPPAELRPHVLRKLTVQQILNLKMPRDLYAVSDEAVQSYYMQNKNQLGHKPLEELREKIQNTLRAQKNHERFRDWMAAVIRTHGVVYYSGYKVK